MRHWLIHTAGRALLALAALAAAPGAHGQGVAVRDGAGDVRSGVLRVGGPAGCCSSDLCQATFVLENRTPAEIGRLRITVSALVAPGGRIDPGQMGLSPALSGLGPLASQAMELSVRIPTGLPPGSYRGTITIERVLFEKDTPSPLQLGVELTVCEPASLRFVEGYGAFNGQKVLFSAPGDDGCRSRVFTARFAVEVHGAVTLPEVIPFVAGLPEGVVSRFTPERVELRPGQTGVFEASLTVPEGVRHGYLVGNLEAYDAATGLRAVTAAALRVCPPDGEEETPIVVEDRPLLLRHRVSRPAVRIGEVVTFTCTIGNPGAATVRDLVLEDALPDGFRYVSERTAVDGRPGPEPDSLQPCRWRLAELAPGAELQLSFQAAVTGRASPGRHSARATVVTGDARVGPIEAEIEVITTPRWSTGRVEGSVRSRADKAAPGVRVLLDSEHETLTDGDGSFAFEAVPGGEHSVSVDPRSLPTGHELLGSDRKLIHLFPGSVERVTFTIGRLPMIEMELRRAPGR